MALAGADDGPGNPADTDDDPDDGGGVNLDVDVGK